MSKTNAVATLSVVPHQGQPPNHSIGLLVSWFALNIVRTFKISHWLGYLLMRQFLNERDQKESRRTLLDSSDFFPSQTCSSFNFFEDGIVFRCFTELCNNKTHDVHHCVLDVLIIHPCQNEGNKKGPKPLVFLRFKRVT